MTQPVMRKTALKWSAVHCRCASFCMVYPNIVDILVLCRGHCRSRAKVLGHIKT